MIQQIETFHLKYIFIAAKIIKTARYVIMKLSEKYPYKTMYEKCLPKTIGDTDAWNISKNDQDELLNRFGNLTLLGQEELAKIALKIWKKIKIGKYIKLPLILLEDKDYSIDINNERSILIKQRSGNISNLINMFLLEVISILDIN